MRAHFEADIIEFTYEPGPQLILFLWLRSRFVEFDYRRFVKLRTVTYEYRSLYWRIGWWQGWHRWRWLGWQRILPSEPSQV